ncbi:PQQ-dependent sugar dehydrogenase [Glycomyces buryatensis]|uniref:PQQ-dependent sugar dehydrogenase n=1 Tax=Glycomyces buryatensis TaxID=2570927 RepID=UPI001B3C172A|nr:PQQ-dependent sugar dehydrogenase [Glycomyces buryatensis]
MITRRRALGFAGAVVAGTAVASCTDDPADEPTSPDESPSSDEPTSPDVAEAPRLGEPEVVAEGLQAPWSIAFVQDTALISERDSARIVELDPDGNAREVGTIAGVAGGGEGGLLGIAVHDGYLYAYFTAAGKNRIERYELTGEAGSFGLGEPQEILGGIPAAANHNGGRIAFGPDGMLYATAGDAGDRESAQDREALSGKILRMTPDGGVPPDNPFADSLVYSWGHRNPQGIAWAEDGTMYASEFGQDTWDELNVIEAGANYGWPEVEGIGDRDEFIDPVQQWAPADASPSGMAIAGGAAFIANLRGERLFEVPLDDPATVVEHYVGEFGRLRDVVVAPDGSLWMITNNTDGRGDPGPDDDRVLRIGLD